MLKPNLNLGRQGPRPPSIICRVPIRFILGTRIRIRIKYKSGSGSASNKNQDPDPQQSDESDPDPHQRDADPQYCTTLPSTEMESLTHPENNY
jgi:hypothetical protein